MPDNATEQMTDNTPKPRIKYVCISDMHLGSKESILTCIDPYTGEPNSLYNSDVLVNLVECLRNLINIDSVNDKNAEKPTLILMGDILDMALSTTEISSACFEGFIELIMPQSSNKKSQMFKDILIGFEFFRVLKLIGHKVDIPLTIKELIRTEKLQLCGWSYN
ncbi:MAG: hypothetical protein HQL03_14980, partial [Nitrospirae bacterium]|nr:hypothetical protein [Nitrospirota bacterium]